MTASAKIGFVVLSFVLISVMRARGLQTYAAVPILFLAKVAGLPAPYMSFIKALSKPPVNRPALKNK